MRTFEFQDETYEYGPDNSERCVEVPIAWKEAQKYRGKNILEFGDVLYNHGLDIPRDILDKYEPRKAANLINMDIVDFIRPKTYDFIFSVSTIEHVGNGRDGESLEPLKVVMALNNLLRSLKDDGHILITFPFGDNPLLGGTLPRLNFNKGFLRKTEQLRDCSVWRECTYNDIIKVGQDHPLPWQNGVVVLWR